MGGENLAIIILQLRLQDAENMGGLYSNATYPTTENHFFKDYILSANGLALRTPCECSFREEHISYVDEILLTQLDKEQIGYISLNTYPSFDIADTYLGQRDQTDQPHPKNANVHHQ